MRPPDEINKVELPFIEQLRAMEWAHIQGDVDVPAVTERTSFREVILRERFLAAIMKINVDEHGELWLTKERAAEGLSRFERLCAGDLITANQATTEALLLGVQIDKDATHGEGWDPFLRLIDWEDPPNNDFLAINQFRLDRPGTKGWICPDIVLFVNGIPLVVVECKSPGIEAPAIEAIDQLMRYANRRDWVEEDEGAERLFHPVQLTVATSWDECVLGTITAGFEHYLEWKDTAPVGLDEVKEELRTETLSSQQTLVAGVLRPELLLDIVRHCVLWMQAGGALIKVAPRYQQYRAMRRAIERLLTGDTRKEDGEHDRRGGVVWHTQGSGKSLAMVFLVRKIRTTPALKSMKVVYVTDRRDLQRQLIDTTRMTGELLSIAGPVERSASDGIRHAPLASLLSEEGPGVVFATIQKYRDRDDDELAEEHEAPGTSVSPALNDSEAIVVLIDEAHRSHTSTLHANLLEALPNAARIGFTGTPILIGARQKTHDIFGDFIDTYTIRQSEEDGSTVPILYEGREATAEVKDGRELDALFAHYFGDRTQEEQEAIRRKYATEVALLQAPEMIAAKARDMLAHYVSTVMPGGFKAQVVAASRLAAMRYQAAITEAIQALLADIDGLSAEQRLLADEQLDALDEGTAFLVMASRHRDRIAALEAAAIISGSHNDPADYAEWSDDTKHEERVRRFKKPLDADGLAFLCVKSMLLTGFDAPIEQVMYLDRRMQGAELLQAIARVNRTATNKSHGLLVDYNGVTGHLTEALAVYRQEDVTGALKSIKDELPVLRMRHGRIMAIFTDRGLDLSQNDACVDLLVEHPDVREQFANAYRLFLRSLDAVLPRPEVKAFIRDQRMLAYIAQRVRNKTRDNLLAKVIKGAQPKVKQLIDDHLIAIGVDPTIGPISISDPQFEDEVAAEHSDRAKAQVMEHAIREHLTVKLHEDPVRFRRLSERLEDMLARIGDHWDQLALALGDLVKDATAVRDDQGTGLDPICEMPFLDIVREARGDDLDTPPNQQAVDATRVVLELIRSRTGAVDFWINAPARTALSNEMFRALHALRFTKDLDALEVAAGKCMDAARALHGYLQP